MDAARTGEVIRKSRIAKKMTQKELSEKLGVTTFAVSKWENGRGLPDISMLEPIASVLDISLNELILGDDTMTDKIEETAVRQLATESVRQTKKKIWLILSGVICIILCFLLYSYLHPSLTILISQPVDPSGPYVETCTVVSSSLFNMPLPSDIIEKEHQLIDKQEETTTDIYGNYKPDWKVDCTVEIKDGKTVLTYQGYVTDQTGTQQQYYKQLICDFILTDNIR